jgi:hypothetical protein
LAGNKVKLHYKVLMWSISGNILEDLIGFPRTYLQVIEYGKA